MSVMPYLVWHGIWIADIDETLYLSYASNAYFNHPFHLSDPAGASGGQTIYPWLQFIPGILIAKVLGIGPFGVGIIWRIWAGITIGLGWYLLAKFYTKASGTALAVSAILLADVGILQARPIVGQVVAIAKTLLGHSQEALGKWSPDLARQWRIITPGLSLGYFLLHILLVARARETPDRKRIIWAGAGLGVLFYTYFYYWTTACLALLVAACFERKKKKVYLCIACIGCLLGLPALLSTLFLKHSTSPDWLVRTDLGTVIPRFAELLIPKVSILLLALTLVWVCRQRKDLTYIWALAFSGMLLCNSQIVTRLQMENIHWMFYVCGPCLSFLVLSALADAYSRLVRPNRVASCAVMLLVVIHLSAGLWLRRVEALETKGSVELTRDYRRYVQQQGSSSFHFEEPNVVIAGDEDFVRLAVIRSNLRPLDQPAIIISPQVTDDELDYRVALNGFLSGLDREAFVASQRDFFLFHWGAGLESRDPVRREERLALRSRKYEQVVSDPAVAVRRFGVKYVALRKEREAPSYLRLSWRQIQDGPYWQVWQPR